MDYVRDTMDWLMGKGRRKVDKDPPTPDGTPGPPYLDPSGARLRMHFVTPTLLPAYVRLPHGVDTNEWLATHTISFFEHVNLLYSCLSEYCNANECSSMLGPQQSQYYWVDEKGKKFKHPAPRYVDFVMSFVHKLIADESIFPTKYGNTFPPSFPGLIKKAWRFLFHVIAHMYAAHFPQIRALELHPHLHTLFVHFSVFNKEFGLVEEDETRVLDDLLDLLLSEGLTGTSPILSTSQSDGALNNRTRSEEALLGSAGALSLPPTIPSHLAVLGDGERGTVDIAASSAKTRLSMPSDPNPGAVIAVTTPLHAYNALPDAATAPPHLDATLPRRSNSGGTASSKSRSSSGHSGSGNVTMLRPSSLLSSGCAEDKENFSPLESEDLDASAEGDVESMDVTLGAGNADSTA